MLDAIDRRRGDELSTRIPSREDLDAAAPPSLRALASAVREKAWDDHSVSAEELADFGDDPGWAPSAAVRVASLIDHLAELALPTGTSFDAYQFPAPPDHPCPNSVETAWDVMQLHELDERLGALGYSGDVWVHDVYDGKLLLRANCWQGGVVEVVALATFEAKAEELTAARTEGSTEKKKKAELDLKRLRTQNGGWADALVRSGFLRAHFGPHLTAEIFKRHVIDRERVDITVDVNAIVHGLVHHIARLAPHVDFARSAVTDLEIQRLADHNRAVWRKACRSLERFPVKGPAWRLLGMPDTTALLVARAEQGGDKAPGADALMAHNFEESVVRSYDVRSVLLSSDNGVARTIAARLRNGAVWVGYVDNPSPNERFVSPLISWPREGASESRYSSLAVLLDELLGCGIADHLAVTDGATTIELRGYLENEHQYVFDWHNPSLFVRGFGAQRVRTPTVGRWPLKHLTPPEKVTPSGARVTIEQVAAALEWVRSSDGGQLSREQLPLTGDAKKDAWTFLRAVNVVDHDGRVLAQAALLNAALHRDVEALREVVLRFEPVLRVVRAIEDGAGTLTEARVGADLNDRTFSSAINVAVATGLVWRASDVIGQGHALVGQESFLQWLLSVANEPIRISEVSERAARELALSPARFQEALAAVIDDPRLEGKRGGSAEVHPLDTKILAIDETGKIGTLDLKADNILGLRTIEAR